jgi:Phosphotransferase enzyme family
LRDLMNGSSLLSGGAVPRHIATGILALIERLPPSDGLCHGDLHPYNVIMTADGPRIIDWSVAVRAPAALDLARCHVMLSEVAVQPSWAIVMLAGQMTKRSRPLTTSDRARATDVSVGLSSDPLWSGVFPTMAAWRASAPPMIGINYLILFDIMSERRLAPQHLP